MNDDERYEDFDLHQDPIQIYQALVETLKKFSSMAIQMIIKIGPRMINTEKFQNFY